ncbi:MAG TPA: DUF4810 domain-containing protein [Herbaspirillum sp.]|uniref:DUF4810 domain-containing protein n=1 Tax=Herbaspirillum sp. TaxID=1890675 RepID=UPI002D5F6586|nr:DUF4810 domain-containing protein [Herbaspirillum sp.]HZG20329.1 DUF4810 domain-containing protein [Herbaspirillum sp.]
MHRKPLLCLLLGLVLSGCAGRPPQSLYGWGNYQDQLYEHFKGDGSSASEQLTALEENLQKLRADGQAIPPGYHAHLGMLYATLGKEDQMIEQWRIEQRLFPESSAYLDFLMRNYPRGATK